MKLCDYNVQLHFREWPGVSVNALEIPKILYCLKKIPQIRAIGVTISPFFTHFVISIQLPHCLLSVYSSGLAHLPPLACKHMKHTLYVHKYRQKESWHLLSVSCPTVFVHLQNIRTYIILQNNKKLT